MPPTVNRAAEAAPARTFGRGDLVLALTAFIGTALRVRQYLLPRSLWFDELLVALNVRNRSLLALAKPPPYQQATPLGFLWATKVSVIGFGQSERAYRLVPCLAGVATVVLVALVARRVFALPAAIAATAIMALAPQSIRYSAELKQYSLEAAITAGLLLAALCCTGRTVADRPRRAVMLAVAGAAALVCSTSAVFVLAGIAVVLVIETARSRTRESYLATIAIGSSWAAAAEVMYRVSWRNDRRNTGLHNYWRAFFGPAPWAHPTWYLDAWNHTIKSQIAISWSWAAIGLSVVGLLWLARRASTLAIVAFVTIASAVVASWKGLYPFDGRLLLFLVPILCLLFGAVVEAVDAAVDRAQPTQGWAAAIIVAGLLVAGSVTTSSSTFEHRREEMHALLDAVHRKLRPGDRLFVSDYTVYAFNFYRDSTGFANVPALIASATPDRIHELNELQAMGPGRIWLVFSRVLPHSVQAEEARYIASHARGRVIQTLQAKGALAVEIQQ